MSSTWPATPDVFPGIPYTDNVEYILAAFANAWATAISGLQNGIGSGSGNSPTNPLYSPAYNVSFSTITARLVNVENSAAGQLVLTTQLTDIMPVSSTAVLGNSGKTADARHQHVGVHSFNGRTGDVTSTAGDLNLLFQHAGDMIVGTGAGTGEIFPGPPSGQGYTLISGGGTDPSGLQWQQALWQAGDVKATSAIIIPTGWLAANGQAVSRTTFSNLLAATTISVTATLTISSNVVSGLSPTTVAMLWVGVPVEGPGIPAGTTVTVLQSTSVQLSNNVAAPGGSQTITFFPYGQGDGATRTFGTATTFNVIDMRGATGIGAGQGNGLTNRIMGAPTGGQESFRLAVGQLPFHTHIFNDPRHHHSSGSTTDTEGQLHNHYTLDGFVYQVMVAYPFSTVNFDWGPPDPSRIAITVTPAQAPPGSVPAIQWGTIPEYPITSDQLGDHTHTYTDPLVTTGASVGNAIDNQGGQASGSPIPTMQPSVVLQYLVKT